MLNTYQTAADGLPPALSVRAVSHDYGGSPVLDEVSLAVEPGEIYCLLGPNGAGKSTLLKAICGRLEPRLGKIRIAGRYPPKAAAARQMIGYVPQDIALYKQLTVKENLAFFGRMSGLSRRGAAAAVGATLARAALEEQADQITGTLSGGFQRRVNIAAAALTNPYLLVLDEPTVGIDVQAREAIHALLRVLQETGTAILLTTHDLDQAQLLASRVGILQAGTLILEGEPQQLLEENFGANKELIVELARPPGRRGESLLHDLQLLSSPSPTTWLAEIPPEGLDAAAFSDYLADNGLEVREVRIRKPDLTSLFLKTAGTPAQA